jgi:hypothetical protein
MLVPEMESPMNIGSSLRKLVQFIHVSVGAIRPLPALEVSDVLFCLTKVFFPVPVIQCLAADLLCDCPLPVTISMDILLKLVIKKPSIQT